MDKFLAEVAREAVIRLAVTVVAGITMAATVHYLEERRKAKENRNAK